MSREPVIKVENLVKNFQVDENTISVLKGLTFEIFSGELVILFGPSGSGKSTLLNLIGGLDKATGGRIIIRGEDIAKYNHNQLAKFRLSKIGMVFQDFNLVNTMTALENVTLPLIFDNIAPKNRNNKAIKLLSEMNLSHRLYHRPVQLSGGEQQRIAIARSLINNPWILLIDEPTGNLDSKSANEIMTIISNLNTYYGRTIILVTHNPNYLNLADRILYINDGQITTESRKK